MTALTVMSVSQGCLVRGLYRLEIYSKSCFNYRSVCVNRSDESRLLMSKCSTFMFVFLIPSEVPLCRLKRSSCFQRPEHMPPYYFSRCIRLKAQVSRFLWQHDDLCLFSPYLVQVSDQSTSLSYFVE